MNPKTDAEIESMRRSGKILATVLETLRLETKPGLSPNDMSAIAKQKLHELGGEPVFLGVPGPPGVMDFPDIICISVNNIVQHGIPTDVPMKKGDIVNYDFGVNYKGMITDSGITVCVGNHFSPETERLVKGTERALYEGLQAVRAGARVGDISAAIERTLRKYKLGIVRELVGHGVGHDLHEEPDIPNYGRAGTGPILKTGMTIAIEPITTLGNPGIVQLRDGWTLASLDGSWSAQFEHTVLVTSKGCEILTQM